jgi:hypothetical protein
MDTDTLTVEKVRDSIGYCGLVCALCHVAEAKGCGGCKSAENSCGRYLSEPGCHQHRCCTERKLNGCWECPDFDCGADMFSGSHDVRLRAFVRCAREEGLEKLAEHVLRNQRNGIRYGHQKDYDGLGSEEAVLTLLRTGRR